MEPIVDLIVLGLYISTELLLITTPVAPAASPILIIVPRFPGSCRFSTHKTKGALPFLSFPRTSERVYLFIFTTAIIPCGVLVSDIWLYTLSLTTSVMALSYLYSQFFEKLSEIYILTRSEDGTSDTILIPSTTYSPYSLLSFAFDKSPKTCFTCELPVLVIIIILKAMY